MSNKGKKGIEVARGKGRGGLLPILIILLIGRAPQSRGPP